MAVGVTVLGPVADAAKIVTRVGDDLVDAAGNIYKKLDGSDTFTDINGNSFQLDNNGDLVRVELPDVSINWIVPGGGLQAHEAAGGHLIERHVGQTDADLIARLNEQPDITAASSFPNRAIAENAVSSAIDANAARIDDFLSGTSNRFVLNHDTGFEVGSVIQRGSSALVSSTSVRVVLQRDASMPTGYRIVTGFPTL